MTDQEINEAVMLKLGKPYAFERDSDRDYCHSIGAAWEIVEFLAPKYFGVSIGHGTNPDFWQCEIHGEKWEKIFERADTAPMAICLAFLKLP